jgi:hypothetical protein
MPAAINNPAIRMPVAACFLFMSVPPLKNSQAFEEKYFRNSAASEMSIFWFLENGPRVTR